MKEELRRSVINWVGFYIYRCQTSYFTQNTNFLVERPADIIITHNFFRSTDYFFSC